METRDLDADGVKYLPFARRLLVQLRNRMCLTGVVEGRKDTVTPDGLGFIYLKTRYGGVRRPFHDYPDFARVQNEWVDNIRITAAAARDYIFKPYLVRVAGSVIIELPTAYKFVRTPLSGKALVAYPSYQNYSVFPLTSSRDPYTAAQVIATIMAGYFSKGTFSSLLATADPFIITFEHTNLSDAVRPLGVPRNLFNHVADGATAVALTETGDNRFITELRNLLPTFIVSDSGRKMLVDYGVVSVSSVLSRYQYLVTINYPAAAATRVLDTTPYGPAKTSTPSSTSAVITYDIGTFPGAYPLDPGDIYFNNWQASGNPAAFGGAFNGASATDTTVEQSTVVYPITRGLSGSSLAVTTWTVNHSTTAVSVALTDVNTLAAYAWKETPSLTKSETASQIAGVGLNVDTIVSQGTVTTTSAITVTLALPNGTEKLFNARVGTEIVDTYSTNVPTAPMFDWTALSTPGVFDYFGETFTRNTQTVGSTTTTNLTFVESGGLNIIYSDPSVPVLVYSVDYYDYQRVVVAETQTLTEVPAGTVVSVTPVSSDTHTITARREVGILIGTTSRVLFTDSYTVSGAGGTASMNTYAASTTPVVDQPLAIQITARKVYNPADATYSIVVKDVNNWVVERSQITDRGNAAARRFDVFSGGIGETSLRSHFIDYMITALDNGGSPVDATALADFQAGNLTGYDVRLMDPRIDYPGSAAVI